MEEAFWKDTSTLTTASKLTSYLYEEVQNTFSIKIMYCTASQCFVCNWNVENKRKRCREPHSCIQQPVI